MCKHMRNNSYRRRQVKFFMFICFLLILSISILMMPISSDIKEASLIPLIITGILFWFGLVGTIWMAININLSRRASTEFKEMYPNIRKFGLIHFFQNKPAIIADVALFVSLLMFILVKLFSDNNILQFIAIALIVFTFGMHCMLNGINYKYVNYKSRREKVS